MKNIFYIMFVLFVSCKGTRTDEKKCLNFTIKENTKEVISQKCEEIDSSKHLFSTTLSRLDNTTVVYIAPIFDSSWLFEKGYPDVFFERNNNLVLVYSGMGGLFYRDIKSQKTIRQKFDSVCHLYHIDKISITYDNGPFFFELKNDSLFEKKTSREFVNSFFGSNIDSSEFRPIEIK